MSPTTLTSAKQKELGDLGQKIAELLRRKRRSSTDVIEGEDGKTLIGYMKRYLAIVVK